jgi:hypothetical protein
MTARTSLSLVVLVTALAAFGWASAVDAFPDADGTALARVYPRQAEPTEHSIRLTASPLSRCAPTIATSPELGSSVAGLPGFPGASVCTW